jgi:hypothetical protein
LVQVAYMVKTLYSEENFKKHAEEATKMFERDINDVIVATKKYMVKASTEMWRCDPDHHVRGIVYVCRGLDNSIYQCSFKLPIKGGVEVGVGESIESAPLVYSLTRIAWRLRCADQETSECL